MNDNTQPATASQTIAERLINLGARCLSREITPFSVARQAFDLGRMIGRAEERTRQARELEECDDEQE